MRLANTIKIRRWTITRVKAQVDRKMFKRKIRLTGKDPKQTAPVPAAPRTRVERQAAIYQTDCDIHIFAEISEGKASKRENVRLVRAKSKRLSSKINTGMPNAFRVCGPAHHREPLVTM